MKGTVIVVDDSEMIRNIISKALIDEYNVVEASDGRMAIEEVRKYKDTDLLCVLLDLRMPRYDGFVLLEYFKTYNLADRIPVFIISGDDAKDTIERAFTYKVVDMLNKPFSPESIKAAVEKAINLK